MNILFAIQEIPGKGRGIVSLQDIEADCIIEVAPVLVMTKEERLHLDQTKLHDYIFEWKANGKDQCCVALGHVSMYNHSYQSNCEYFMDYEQKLMFIKTVSAIKAGEELLINYNGDWNNETPLWFEAIK